MTIMNRPSAAALRLLTHLRGRHANPDGWFRVTYRWDGGPHFKGHLLDELEDAGLITVEGRSIEPTPLGRIYSVLLNWDFRAV